ncbi:Apical membrane antigen 1 [Theileria orientalis]|uniref:Apical membrane antigen 1 n=1 Tax=Theileria orientalis TaxID=68886 RepID=A0A976QRR3_THEOR|nr:Apical membrane antigen 1 [Theileria orientalis]
MKFNYLLNNLVFCAVLYNIKAGFKAAYATSDKNTLCGDVNSRLPVVLVMNIAKSTNEFDYIASENNETVRYEAKCNFAFQTILIMPSKSEGTRVRQDLYEADSPSKRASKVIKTKEGEGSRVEIHLLNGDVITFVKSSPSDQYVRESGGESESDKAKERLATNRSLLWGVLIVLSGVFSIVVGAGTLYYLKKRRLESENLSGADVEV